MTYVEPLNNAWYDQVCAIMAHGQETAPRGQKTLELPQRTLVFDMNFPVVTHPLRKLGYKFMAAEAWWILDGRDDVASIAPYSKEISRFSDDGHKFFGAYGPPIARQLGYVVHKLLEDDHTRQAVITMWRECPPETKDVPCTVAFSYMIRNGKLNAHVFMRSSDNWLGVPYDAFNFSMLAAEICRRVNRQRMAINGQDVESYIPLELGTCFLTAASSHLYERNFAEVHQVIEAGPDASCGELPAEWLISARSVVDRLRVLKNEPAGSDKRWWAQP